MLSFAKVAIGIIFLDLLAMIVNSGLRRMGKRYVNERVAYFIFCLVAILAFNIFINLLGEDLLDRIYIAIYFNSVVILALVVYFRVKNDFKRYLLYYILLYPTVWVALHFMNRHTFASFGNIVLLQMGVYILIVIVSKDKEWKKLTIANALGMGLTIGLSFVLGVPFDGICKQEYYVMEELKAQGYQRDEIYCRGLDIEDFDMPKKLFVTIKEESFFYYYDKGSIVKIEDFPTNQN